MKKINLVSADMGYGHQRASYPLLDLSEGELITINNYPGMPAWEGEYWKKSLAFYESVSRLTKIPVIGSVIFGIMDHFQRIKPFSPFRDLSKQSWQQKMFLRAIKKGLGKKLIEALSSNGLPFVTTFFVAAYAAEYHSFKGDIYCVVCDTDVSRAWGPLYPKTSKLKFFAPNERVRTRLMMYGVKAENIFVTGFPLPKENVGLKKELVSADLAARLLRLDPEKKEASFYEPLLSKDGFNFFQKESEKQAEQNSLTIVFAVGGAGAQKEMATEIINQLEGEIKSGKLHLKLVAGVRQEVRDYFINIIKEKNLTDSNSVEIIYDVDKIAYFRKFNACIRNADVLWTKPSELSFYCGLGLPIVITKPIGSQEIFNRQWLLDIEAGVDAPAKQNLKEWWNEIIKSGRFAKLAVKGFSQAANQGAYKIEEFFN